MKKLTVWLLLCALMLSLGTVLAAAELPEGISFTPGAYADGDGSDFTPVSNVPIEWMPDCTEKIDLYDGSIADWRAAGTPCAILNSNYLISWIGNDGKASSGGQGAPDSAMPAKWGLRAYFAADADYLYMAFDITDSNFAYATSASSYNGDALQIALDFGNVIGDQLKTNPEVLSNPKNVFYSLACVQDGAPIEIMVQESDQDGLLSEANGDAVRGSAYKTSKGWLVEIALGWQMLFDQYVWKVWDEDGKIYIGTENSIPLRMGATLYYINRETDGGGVTWAAGTCNQWLDESGTPCISWTAWDNSMTMVLPWSGDDMDINCTGIVELYADSYYTTEYEDDVIEPPEETDSMVQQTYPAVEDWVDTEPPEGVTVPPEWEETIRDAVEEESLEDELNAILEKYGCSAVAGMGSLTACLLLAVAACLIRKKD